MTARPGGCTQAIGLGAGPRHSSRKKKSPFKLLAQQFVVTWQEIFATEGSG